MSKPPYQVYLYPVGYGCRTDKRRGFKRWFVSYETRRKDGSKPRREIEWLDVETREEAKAERDRRYTELLLHGAKWKGEEKKKTPAKPPKKKSVAPDDYLCRSVVKRVWWKVMIKGQYIGGSFSKLEARKIRDAHLRGKSLLKPCAVCGKTPVWAKDSKGRSNTLVHDEPDCPSRCEITWRDLSKYRKAQLWNKKIRRGKFPVKGKITKSDIDHLV